jgi:MFS family permease
MSVSASVIGDTRGDSRVTGLVAGAHFFSHLYILCLPPIFPVLQSELGVTGVQLGLLIAAINITTMVAQPPTGFLVDRFGPARILIIGHSLFALAIALLGLAPSYAAMIGCLVLAGLGNAVYHPADYSILANRISGSRVGRAFSIHTFGGYAGFAAAPLTVVPLTEAFGWRPALVLLGIAGFAMTAALVIWRDDLAIEVARARDRAGDDPPAQPRKHLLLTAPILLSLLFYLLLAAGHSGLTSFSPTALDDLYGFGLIQANLPVTTYLVVSAFGVLLGGWFADRTGRHDLVVGTSSLVIAMMAALVAAASLSLPWLTAAFFVAGLASGVIAPSRDMLVRAVTPRGASGKVFGFVMTGFNIGSLLAPPLYGLLLDHGSPRLVFWAVAAFSLATVLTVVGAVGDRSVPRAA